MRLLFMLLYAFLIATPLAQAEQRTIIKCDNIKGTTLFNINGEITLDEDRLNEPITIEIVGEKAFINQMGRSLEGVYVKLPGQVSFLFIYPQSVWTISWYGSEGICYISKQARVFGLNHPLQSAFYAKAVVVSN